MDRLLSRLGAWLWPALLTLGARERERGLANVLGVLYCLPFAVAGLGWLIASTGLPDLRLSGMLLAALLLMLLFDQVPFFQVLERGAGRYASNSASLAGIVQISALLLLGPAALWPIVLAGAILHVRTYIGKRGLAQWSWSAARNAVFDLALTTCGLLLGLGVYRWLGGSIPMRGLAPADVLPAAGMLLSYLVVALLFGLGYALLQQWAGVLATFVDWMKLWVPLALMIGVIQVFGILAAGIYSRLGAPAYGFLIAGVLLAAVLTHRLSRAVELSWQRSRELAQLEALGRAIIAAPPDAGGLDTLLATFVPRMFAYHQIGIRLDDGTTLLQLPPTQASTSLPDRPEEPGRPEPPIDPAVWAWLQATPTSCCFETGDVLPWNGQRAPHAMVVAPMRDAATAAPFGAICVVLADQVTMPSGALSAVEALGAQIAAARNRAEGYAQMLANQRVTQELATAWEIQASFLPAVLPQPDGWQLSAYLRPARETSGDFYDVLRLPTGHLGLLIADVTDKGMGAALFMALSRTLIRTYALDYPQRPDRALQAANTRMLAESIGTGMFVTAFYGVLDVNTGCLTYCNAGHNPPLYLHGDTQPPRLLANTGLPLGIEQEATWETRTVEMMAGDRLVLYTDGVTEAQNADGELFEVERLLASVRSHAEPSAERMQAAILDAVDGFVGTAPQFDDITVMVLLRSATGEHAA